VLHGERVSKLDVPGVVLSWGVVVDQHALTASMTADLDLGEADVAVLQVVGEEVKMNLRSAIDDVDVLLADEMACVSALRIYNSAH
jgi:hypothetical protein